MTTATATPIAEMTPSELRAFCDEHGIAYRPKDSAKQLRTKIDKADIEQPASEPEEIAGEVETEPEAPASPLDGISDPADLVFHAVRLDSVKETAPTKRGIAAYRAMVSHYAAFLSLDVPQPSSAVGKTFAAYAKNPGRAKPSAEVVAAAGALVLAEAKAAGLVSKTRARSSEPKAVRSMLPGLLLHKNGKRVARPTSLSFLAWAATKGIDDAPRVGIKRLVELLAEAGVTNPYETEWSVELPNGVTVAAVREG